MSTWMSLRWMFFVSSNSSLPSMTMPQPVGIVCERSRGFQPALRPSGILRFGLGKLASESTLGSAFSDCGLASGCRSDVGKSCSRLKSLTVRRIDESSEDVQGCLGQGGSEFIKENSAAVWRLVKINIRTTYWTFCVRIYITWIFNPSKNKTLPVFSFSFHPATTTTVAT